MVVCWVSSTGEVMTGCRNCMRVCMRDNVRVCMRYV